MKKKKKLYEGKAKIVYETDDPIKLIQEFKDDATAFNGKKKGRIAKKGYVNNQISSHLFRLISSYNIHTHFVDLHADNSMVITRLDMIPVEFVVRNYAAGSLLKKTKLKEGEKLEKPLVQYFLKDDAKGDPEITKEDILKSEATTPDELEQLSRLSLKINAILSAFFERRNVKLVDYKLEFGHDKEGRIVLGDEISPDTCRFWDMNTNEKLDKDRFRQDLGNVEEAYEEMRRRVYKEEAY